MKQVTMVALALAAAASAQTISPADKAAGAQANPRLVQQYGGAYQGAQAAFVERVGRRVSAQSGLSASGDDFTVTLLDSPVENAFAIPGGYLYVTRQLLALMNSEAELAAVLGHETGHVAARHSAKRGTRSALGGLAAAVVGAVTKSDLAGRAAGYGSQLYTLGFSRGQEYEADALGVRYMTAAGYDPYAEADILGALNDETALQASITGTATGQPTWMSTHPNGADRVERAHALAAATGRPEGADVQDTAFLRMLDGLPYDAGDKRVRIVTVAPGDTAERLAARMFYRDHQLERFAVLNGLDPAAPLTPGRLVKIIAAR